MRVMSLARGGADFARREADRQDEAAAAQRDGAGDAPVDVAFAQDALLRDVVEREGVVGVDPLQAVFLVALDDRADARDTGSDRSGRRNPFRRTPAATRSR